MSSTARYGQQMDSPWVQGVIGGALALVPARRWPRWVRGAYIWVPTLGAASLAAAPELWRGLVKEPDREEAGQQARASTQRDVSVQHVGVGERDLGQARRHAIEEAESAPKLTAAQLGLRLAAAAAVGGAFYGLAKLSLWADDAMEEGLRRIHVPAPRLTLAVASGAACAWISSLDAGERGSAALDVDAQDDEAEAEAEDNAEADDPGDLDDEPLDDGLPEED